jgi:hypothetical protein
LKQWSRFICGLALLGGSIPMTFADDGSLHLSAEFPPRAQLLAFLAQNIAWYHSLAGEKQLISDPADLLFLEDNRSIIRQVVRLSFDFAKFANGYTTEVDRSPQFEGNANSAADPVLQNLVTVEGRANAAALKAVDNLQRLVQQRSSARGADRDRLDLETADAKSQVAVLQSMTATLRSLREFSRATDTGQTDAADLATFVDGLEQTVPEVSSSEAASARILPSHSSFGSPSSDLPTGILDQLSRVSALAHKLRTVDETAARTDELTRTSQRLLAPLAADLNRALQNPDLLATSSEFDNLSALQQQEARLNALMSETSKISPAITALAKQKVLLTLYQAHLASWRVSIAAQYRSAQKDVAVRVVVLCGAIALVIAASALVRKMTSMHVRDANSRHMILIGQRLTLWLSIILIVAFGFAFDLKSLATFLGIVSAGLAVAMQNVILAVVGYFFLVGKLHLRVGDLVEMSGVRGEVIEIGLMQFRLREVGELENSSTGRIVSFSNSFIFVSPATGLFKHGDLRKATGA